MKKSTLGRLFALTLPVVALFALLVCPVTFAQTPQPPTQQTFFQSVGDYFTSFNPAYSMVAAHKLEVWTAAEYQNQINFADDLGVDYRFDSGLKLEAVMRNAGIGGIIVDSQIGIGYSLAFNDVEVSAGVNGGYLVQERHGVFVPYIDFRKCVTENTYLGLRLSYDAVVGAKSSNYPSIAVITGFKF
jgi:hypothetical protein